MKFRVSLITFLLFILFPISHVYGQGSNAGDIVKNEIIKPINEFHKKAYNMVAPYDFEADERNRSNLPGLFTDLSRSGENEDDAVKPGEDEKREFKYGFHRTLQSVADIGNKDAYTDHLDKMLESKQVTAFINAAQTQPAAAAGLHYGLMNSQLTLVNQQLSHTGFFEQMSQMPDGAKLLQSMYTGCINRKLTDDNLSFAEAHRSCIGDKVDDQEREDGDAEEVAEVKDIADHPDNGGGSGGGDDEILCSHLLFEQQDENIEDFKEDFLEWFGDEATTIEKVEGESSGAKIARRRILPEESLLKKFQFLVEHRYENFTALIHDVCEATNDRSGSNSLDGLMDLSNDNVWKEDRTKKIAGILSIEGFEFNSMVAEALLKTFADITDKPGEDKLDCNLLRDCNDVYDDEDGFYVYQADNDSSIASVCKSMHDYAEGVALGHMAEAISRVRRIIMDYTVSDPNSDARQCGLRIIHDQLKTSNIEYVQNQAAQHLIEVSETIYRDRARESGKTAQSGLSTQGGNKEASSSQ